MGNACFKISQSMGCTCCKCCQTEYVDIDTVTTEIIRGTVTNYLKTQDSKIGKDYFKFIPQLKVLDGNASKNLTYQDFIDNMKTNPEFIDDFIQILKIGTDFDQYYFECIPVKKSTMKTEGFEFVLKKATDLANRSPDYRVFEDELRHCKEGSVSFEYGLRKDSTLICPCVPENMDDQRKYIHLAIFVREAPKPVLDSVLKKAATVMEEKVNQSNNADQKWFLSTDGSGGTAWLHVRISERAKYYSFDEYRFSGY